MADTKKFIKKIKLDNDAVYYVYDTGAPRISDLDNYLPLSGGTLTGNLTVDALIQAGSLKVVSIDYIGTSPENVLVQAADGTIKKRSTDDLLADIGGISYAMDDATGTLSFKFGKQ